MSFSFSWTSCLTKAEEPSLSYTDNTICVIQFKSDKLVVSWNKLDGH